MKNNQLQLVTFEQAKRLKKAGFDCATTHFYVDDSEYKAVFAFWQSNPVAYGHEPRNWNTWKIGGECGNTSAPTVALALQYVRQEHNLSGEIWRTASGWMWEVCKADNGTNISHLDAYDNHPGTNDGGAFDDFDDCASNVLDELLTLIEK